MICQQNSITKANAVKIRLVLSIRAFFQASPVNSGWMPYIFKDCPEIGGENIKAQNEQWWGKLNV